jgi:hypothetical protein
MAWYADLAPCDYFGPAIAPRLLAVGWLEPGHPFSTGDVAEEVFDRLCVLLRDPWNVIASSGGHTCGFCRFTGGVGTASYRGSGVRGYSTQVVFVPGEGVVYVAPESITHCIDAHGYCPPEEFCHAVLACPAMGSMAYRRAILNNGGRELVRAYAPGRPPDGA